MSVIIAGVGGYGYHVLSEAGGIVANTYDRPMMAINFARAASVDFLEMQNDALRAEAAPPAKAATLDKQIDDLAATLSDDLDVAYERSTANDERGKIREIRALVRQWTLQRHAGHRPVAGTSRSILDQKVLDAFDLLIEYNADHGFVSRREAVSRVSGFEDAVVGMTGAALLLAAAVTLFLVRRIVRPLRTAAEAADRIAAGQFETDIPEGGKDETGALLASMHVMQDSIAAQMAREKARATSAEGRLIDAIENSSEGVILADDTRHIVVANSALSRLFPQLAAQLVPGQSLPVALAAVEAQSRPAAANAAVLSHEIDAVATPAWTERQLPDGRWLRITASRTREGGSILFFSDFTDIKLREERYRLAKQQAEAANAAKSRFLANMSHELRTPLNAVIGFSEILTGEIFGPLGHPRYLEYSGDILQSGRNLLKVINDVLDLAKSESGAIELRKAPVDVTALVTDCCQALAEWCDKAGLTFTRPDAMPPLLVDADEPKLRQALLNLFSNAAKFTDRGGSVCVGLTGDAGSVCIAVRDTGIGMAPPDIATALTPFAQVDARLERRYEGTGLGLPLSKAFIEAHGGTLSIESEPGRGTTVLVRLQRGAAGAVALAAAV